MPILAGMARSPHLEATSAAYRALEHALAEPEPMCLVVASVESEADLTVVVDLRLRNHTRAYDAIWQIDQWSYALTLRTLADASVLESRIQDLFELLSKAYPLGDEMIRPTVRIGAAVRMPEDTASSLLDRIGQALFEADAAGCRAPVLL